jgi:hypothetical protein
MDGVLSVFTAFGLSSSAGLNAYLPLLIVALVGRFTDLITLNPPWDAMESWWVIGVLAVLLVVEIIVDKIPAVDTVNDAIHTIIRPVAGAILFAASTGSADSVHPVLALICGLFVAGGVHAVKATARPIVTGTTAGIANPIVSTAEDVLSIVVAVLAIVVPLLALLLLIGVLIWFIRRRRRRGQEAPPQWW